MITRAPPAPMPFTFAIDWKCCVSPIKADGMVNGHPWFFREQGSRWEFAVSLDPAIAPRDLARREDVARGFCLYGAATDVGNQQEQRIRALIAWAARQFHLAESTGDLALCCRTCPDPAGLAEELARDGFRLTFQMAGERAQSNGTIPTLPAQYHYRADNATEVLYLAGRDRIEVGLPIHTCRFWLTRGNDAMAYRRIIAQLSRRFAVVAPRIP
jgi:hypothetical protein